MGSNSQSVLRRSLWILFAGIVLTIYFVERNRRDREQNIQPKPPTFITVSITPEARVKATAEEIPHLLQRGKWSEFTIKIENAAGITAPLSIESDQLLLSQQDESPERWLSLDWDASQSLSGQAIEYRQLRLRSRDSGMRAVVLNFNAGQGTQDLGFRSDVLITFRIAE